jgi:hypothetical protein
VLDLLHRPDHLGSTRLVSDQDANVIGRHDYPPFGEEIAANVGGRDGTFGTSDLVRAMVGLNE